MNTRSLHIAMLEHAPACFLELCPTRVPPCPPPTRCLRSWLRQKRGDMTFESFSELTKLPRSSLHRYENGQSRISESVKLKLARAFADFPDWAIPRAFDGTPIHLAGANR
jgi:hypothetical protein